MNLKKYFICYSLVLVSMHNFNLNKLEKLKDITHKTFAGLYIQNMITKNV
jgi:hypothetical protein